MGIPKIPNIPESSKFPEFSKKFDAAMKECFVASFQ